MAINSFDPGIDHLLPAALGENKPLLFDFLVFDFICRKP